MTSKAGKPSVARFAAQPLSALQVSHTEHGWDAAAFVLPVQVAFTTNAAHSHERWRSSLHGPV